jgi:hypothetical protein
LVSYHFPPDEPVARVELDDGLVVRSPVLVETKLEGHPSVHIRFEAEGGKLVITRLDLARSESGKPINAACVRDVPLAPLIKAVRTRLMTAFAVLGQLEGRPAGPVPESVSPESLLSPENPRPVVEILTTPGAAARVGRAPTSVDVPVPDERAPVAHARPAQIGPRATSGNRSPIGRSTTGERATGERATRERATRERATRWIAAAASATSSASGSLARRMSQAAGGDSRRDDPR